MAGAVNLTKHRLRQCWAPRPHTSADEIEELVTARLARQALLARADPPLLYVFLDSVADGQTVEDAAIVAQVTQRFDALRAEALPRGASRDMIRKSC